MAVAAATPHENVPPQNLEAEESVLGAMMIAPAAIDAVTEILEPGDFYRESHGRIYQAAVSLHMKNEPVDAITLTNELDQLGELDRVGGRVRLHELARLVPASANARHYAEIVRENATLRGLIRAGGQIAQLGWDHEGEPEELVSQAEQVVFDLTQHRDSSDLEHLASSLRDTHRLMQEQAHSEITGLPTGLRLVDELTAGLQPGNLVIVAARPSMGKSALAIGIANHVAALGKPVGVFSLEMSRVEVNQRLLSHRTGISLHRLRKPRNLHQPDWAMISTIAAELADEPIYIDDSGSLRMSELRARARRLRSRQPDLALIVVDYLQLMVGEQRIENRVQEVSQISRGLKILARDLNVPVLALSQLNRALEQRTDKRPILSDLRESGSIEQDADVVMFIYRDEMYHAQTDEPGVAELIVGKHRNGPTGMVKVAWRKQTARFHDA